MPSKLEFCPVCHYYLYLETADKLTKCCKNCGYRRVEEEGGLILESNVQKTASEEYKYVVNEFTKQDPRLPHFKNLKCPNTECASAKGEAESDVIVIKYDQKNLKFVYICNVCDAEWRSQ